MAIGSVYELVDYKKETVKIAKQYGGGEVDLGAIADVYNSESTSPYPAGSFIIYEGSLYKSNTTIPVNAGDFNPEMWDQVPAFDETATYNTGDNVEYAASVYRCDEDNVTGEFDLTKWTAVPQDYPLYDEDETYYAGYSKVTYGDHYYVAGSNYQQSGTVGSFNPSKWTETSVAENLTTIIKRYHYTMEATVDSRTQVMIPVTGERPTNIFVIKLSMVNPDGDKCECDCNFPIGGGFGGSLGNTTLVMPYSTGIRIMELQVGTILAAGAYIIITVKRVTDISLSGGDLALTTNTEMIFPATEATIYSLSDNVKVRHISNA